jgi:maltose alpha-D-glucosyltransferase/alpha-amylase
MPTANHDIPRPTCGRDEQEVRTIFAMLLTMPGVPFIYYGDEIGMDYIYPTPDKEGGTIGTLQRSGSRTPLQWSKEKNAGFSTAPQEKLYLPIDPSPLRPDVATEEKDPASMLNFTRALLKLRHPIVTATDRSEGKVSQLVQSKIPRSFLWTTALEFGNRGAAVVRWCRLPCQALDKYSPFRFSSP